MFNNCKNIEEAKTAYRDLSKSNHPDKGGSEDLMKQINLEYERFLNNFIDGRVSDFAADKDYDINSEPFADMLKKVVHFDMDIEIIGFWIYARDCWSAENKETLKDLGFWYSKKHSAYIFSGGKKKRIKSKLTTNDVRNLHGSTTIKEKDDKKKIA